MIVRNGRALITARMQTTIVCICIQYLFCVMAQFSKQGLESFLMLVYQCWTLCTGIHV